MATLVKSWPPERLRSQRVPPEPEKIDRYELGWREITRITEEGEVVYERQPLTLWDILHPQVGDFRVHTDEHERFCAYLLDVFLGQVAHIPHAHVLHDTRVAWATPGIEAHGPDIAVIFHVTEKDNWATFDENEEETKPTLIVEIVSPKIRRVDVQDKFAEYAQVGVEYYIIVDARLRRGRTIYSLLGYQLHNGVYEPIKPNEQWWLWLPPVRVWLGIHHNWLVCYDVNHQPIGDYVQVVQEREIALARAEQAQQATELAHQEAKQAHQEAEEAKQRADRAEQRAAAEQKARQAMEEQFKQLADELRRLRQQT
jgi:Uma2 family endonuclease